MKPHFPSITIAIPTFNGLVWLENSISAFLQQDYGGIVKILALDSGSTDGTVKFLRANNIRVVRLQSLPFNHGRARNEIINYVDTELVLYTVQDAKPRSSKWLQDMSESIINSESDAICGGQCVPTELDKNPLRWYMPVQDIRQTKTYNHADYLSATLKERKDICRWDNVNAIYRAQTLREVPFPELPFGEDMAWAKAALSHDKTIGYCDHGKVYHYHHETPEFIRSRVVVTAHLHWKLFQCAPTISRPPTFLWFMKTAYTIIYRCRITSPLEIAQWLRHNLIIKSAYHKSTTEATKAIQEGNFDLIYNNLDDKAALAKHHDDL